MRERWARTVLFLVALAGCGDPDVSGPGPDTPAGRVILSDPVTSGAVSAGDVGLLSAQELVYVSAAPGTVAEGSEVRITNRASGTLVDVTLQDGGFDPVPLAASAGETLAVLVSLHGRPIQTWSELVPTSSPPIVVRTAPARGKRDVPVAASMLVMFSEPMDPSSLESFVQLLLDGAPVAGSVDAAEDLMTATFTPAAPLAHETDYVLAVAAAVQDLDGDALGRTVLVNFTTARPPAPFAGVYERVEPWTYPNRTPRFVLNEDYTFALSYPPRFGPIDGPSDDFPGTYVVNGGDVAFTFSSAHTNGEASGTIVGDSLVVRYSAAMRALPITVPSRPVKFEDGAFERTDSPTPPLPLLAGRLAFESFRDGYAVPHVYVSDPTGAAITHLTSGSSPSWSPGGDRIAFARWNDPAGPDGIYTIASNGTDERWLGSGNHPAWSPDGTRIVFAEATRRSIGVMNVDGTALEWLTSYELDHVARPTWSPDGERIAFVGTVALGDLPTQIHWMRADRTVMTALSIDGCNGPDRADWSPDGTSFAFGQCATASIVSTDGTSRRYLGWGAFPVWSPDGRWLVGRYDDNWYLLDPNGGLRRLLIADVPPLPGFSEPVISWTPTEGPP